MPPVPPYRRHSERTLFALCLLVFPAVGAAQEGSVTYDHSVQFDFEMPEALRERVGRPPAGRPGGDGARGQGRQLPPGIPTESYGTVILHFTASESVMRRVEAEEDDAASADPRAQRMAGFAARLRMISPSRSDHEILHAAYSNLADGAQAESLEFMGRTFLIRGTQPEYEWRLVDEQKEFMGYMVQKAVAQRDSSTIEAWFTPQIPVSAGPGRYGGLPGLILVVSVDRGDELYQATDIDLSSVPEGIMTPPDEGEVVSREEYEQMVEEKLEEVRLTRQRRRIR